MQTPRFSSTFMEEKHKRTKVPFPFPMGTVLDINLDRVCLLIRNLKILKIVRTFQIEKYKFEIKINGLIPPASKESKKKEEKVENQYENLNEEMFYSSQGSLVLLHLLFECYDCKEAETRFRDVWPIYEKKIEGLLRRVLLEWLKEVIEANPGFFSSIKLEALTGLLVNPGGDRFIQLIESFVNLVMYNIVQQKKSSSIEHPEILLKEPHYVNNSEITSRQILVLAKKTQTMVNNNRTIRKKILKNALEAKSRLKTLKTRKPKYSSHEAIMHEKIENLIDLMEKLEVYPNTEKTDNLYYEKLIPVLGNLNKQQFKLIQDIGSTLSTKTMEAVNLFNMLDDFHERLNNLWSILSTLRMEVTQTPALDGTKLFILNKNEGSTPQLMEFIKTIHVLISGILMYEPFKALIPSTLLVDLKKIDSKFEYLHLFWKEFEEEKYIRKSRQLKEYKAKLEAQKGSLENVDWSLFSKVYNSRKTTISYTPTKRFDFETSTGYTPRLNNFLFKHSEFSDVTSTQARVHRIIGSLNHDVPTFSTHSIRKELSNPTNSTNDCFNSGISTSYNNVSNSSSGSYNRSLMDDWEAEGIMDISSNGVLDDTNSDF